MNKRDFIESTEWQLIRTTVEAAISGAQREMLVLSDILAVKEMAGRIKACQEFLALPDLLLHDESDKLINERTDTVSLVPPRRNPTKVF